MGKKIEERNEFFEDLKAGLTAAIEHAEGRRKDLRTTTLPRPPRQLSAKEIVEVRKMTIGLRKSVRNFKPGGRLSGEGGDISRSSPVTSSRSSGS